MEYFSTTEIAKKWGISVQRVRVLCQDERIAGVTKVGKCYMIPASAEKPPDFRKPGSVDYRLSGEAGGFMSPEKELLERQEKELKRCRMLFDFVPAGLAIYKKCGEEITMLRINQFLRDRTGLSDEKLLNIPIEQHMEYIYPEDIRELLAALQQCFRSQVEQEVTFRIWDYNTKQYRWFHMCVRYGVKDEEVQYAFANFLDITESQKIQAELDENQKLLEQAEVISKVHYLEYDARTKLTTMSKRVAKLYDLPRIMDDYPRQICRPDALFPEDYKTYCDKFEEVRSGREKEVLFNARIKDQGEDRYIWRRVRFVGSYNQAGELVKINGVSQDVHHYQELGMRYFM